MSRASGRTARNGIFTKLLAHCAAVALVVAFTVSAHAADHQWQRGVWRDMQQASASGGSLSIPLSLAVAGIQPAYLSLPIDDETEVVIIDGPNNLQYVARSRHRFQTAIVNDPVEFAVEGTHLFVRGSKAGQAFKLTLVKTIRLPN